MFRFLHRDRDEFLEPPSRTKLVGQRLFSAIKGARFELFATTLVLSRPWPPWRSLSQTRAVLNIGKLSSSGASLGIMIGSAFHVAARYTQECSAKILERFPACMVGAGSDDGGHHKTTCRWNGTFRTIR